MTAMSTFTTFMNVTGPSFVTGVNDIQNEAQRKNYLIGRFLRGSDNARTMQGGTDIRDSVMFDEQSSASFYGANSTFSETNPQVVVNWKAYWRFLKDSMVWTDQEILLQIPDGVSTPARHQVYKRVKYSKEQRLWTSKINFMEDHLWTVPQTADMESEGGLQSYSVPAHVNEYTNGQFFNVGGTAAGGYTIWTTKQNINPSSQSGWRIAGGTNATAGLPATPADDNTNYTYSTTTWASLFNAMDRAWMFTRFTKPPTRQEYFSDPALYKQVIVCSFGAQAHYMAGLRAGQDTYATTSRQDPAYVQPQFAGIDVERVAALNSAALYPAATTANALVSELSASADNIGYRYYFLNGNYLTPVFHSQRFFVKHPAIRHRDQPFTSVQYVDTWMNLVARSLQRHALVSPYTA